MPSLRLIPCPRLFVVLLALAPLPALAQVPVPGLIWQKIADPDFVLQLQREEGKEKFYERIEWAKLQNDAPRAANYCRYVVTGKTGDYSTATHRFTLTADPRAARAEMKVQLHGAYRDAGIYQFEGEVRFTPGTPSASHIMQIWQNMKKTQNKILIYNVRAENGGTLVVPANAERSGTFKNLPGLYARYNAETGQWLKVNVVHWRAQRRVMIFLGERGELYNDYVHGDADGEYYFKFGAYGRIAGQPLQEATVEWRHVKMFEGKAAAPAKP